MTAQRALARSGLPGLIGGLLVAGCAGAAPPGPARADDARERPPVEASPAPEPSADPPWIAELIEVGAAVADAAGLEAFAARAGQQLAARLLSGMSPAEEQEASSAIQMLLRLEWDPVLAGDAEFSDPGFRRALARAALVGLAGLLAGHPGDVQLDRLRCALIDLQLRALRRDALAAAKRRFDGALDAAAASQRGMELALMIELLGSQERDLADRCDGADLRAADLANARIDVGFVVGGDPCDTLSWDVYIHIQAHDDLLPAAERTLGGDCVPKVLVLD